MAALDKRVEGHKQFMDVMEMQTRSRLVEYEQGRVSFLLADVVGELYALVFSARKGG